MLLTNGVSAIRWTLIRSLTGRLAMKTSVYEGYYDGKNIITDAKLEKDQRVRIIPVDSAAGALHQYKDVSKISREKEVFANEMVKKHS